MDTSSPFLTPVYHLGVTSWPQEASVKVKRDGVHFLADKMLKRQGVIMTLLGGSVMELVESTLALELDSLGSSLASVPYHLCDDR